ncbi:MAG: transmembrane 220 family protein [Pirellulaceae bacterium]
MIIKVVHWIFGLLFLWSAALQYNDPDFYVWLPYFAFAGFVAILCGCGMRCQSLVWMVLGAACIFLLQSIPGVSDFVKNDDGNTWTRPMSNDYPYMEVAREFGGAVITAVWCLFAILTAPRIAKAET